MNKKVSNFLLGLFILGMIIAVLIALYIIETTVVYPGFFPL